MRVNNYPESPIGQPTPNSSTLDHVDKIHMSLGELAGRLNPVLLPNIPRAESAKDQAIPHNTPLEEKLTNIMALLNDLHARLHI